MHVFIDFWKLETENSISHVFSFLHNLSFKNNFCFLSILGCQTRILVLKIENCFWKQKIRRKNNYQTYPNLFGRKKMNERNKRSKGFFFYFFFYFLCWISKTSGTIWYITTHQFKTIHIVRFMSIFDTSIWFKTFFLI